MINSEEKGRINARIAQIIEECAGPLKKVGATLKAKCPFHDDQHPSLNITESKGLWHCPVCDIGGDAFTFIEKFHKVDFKKALELLGIKSEPQKKSSIRPVKKEKDQDNPVDLEVLYNLCREETIADHYLKFARIAPPVGVETAKKLGVAYWKAKSAFLIPFRNVHGKIIALQVRNFAGKKWSVKGSHYYGSFYGIEHLPENDVLDVLYVCEGATDYMAGNENGIPTIGRFNKNARPISDNPAIKKRIRAKKIVIIPDRDDEGETSAIDFNMAGYKVVIYKLPPEYKDFREYCQNGFDKKSLRKALCRPLFSNLLWRKMFFCFVPKFKTFAQI